MEFAIDAEGFEGHRLTLQIGGLLSGPKLFLDGAPVKGARGGFTLRRNDESEVRIRLRPNLLDPVPRVDIDGHVLQLVRPLAWYEYVWIGLPILLLLVGGGLGAVCGVVAVYASARVFRSQRSAVGKYGLTGVISVAAVVVYVLLAALFPPGIVST